MEFFSDHWVLWTCFLVPALFWIAVADYRRLTSPQASPPLPGLGLARFVAWTATILLVVGLIHVLVGLIV